MRLNAQNGIVPPASFVEKQLDKRMENNEMVATNGNPAFSGSDDKPSD
ncbi:MULTISPECIES: hypothetical protein [Pseudomonas]|nr:MULTISPECIES: hypothetical protein [Pseudomonas]